MLNRKLLYGYIIRNGELTVETKEAETVKRIFSNYLEGLSYQGIADMLNGDKIPFSVEAPAWNKHKVKRLLENPRYLGNEQYPAIIKEETFAAVQSLIQSKTANYTSKPKAANKPDCAVREPSLIVYQMTYMPSADVIKADNAVNRALEKQAPPGEIIGLILQGITARYACCG